MNRNEEFADERPSGEQLTGKPLGHTQVETELFAALVEPLARLDCEVVDVTVGPGVVRVLIDSTAQKPVDLELITTATREVSVLVEDQDPLPGSYHLEVSTPGIERPLVTPAHFERFLGKQVALKLRPDSQEPRRIVGELVEADSNGITLTVSPGVQRRLAYGEIDRARLYVDWSKARIPKAPKREKKQKSSRGSAVVERESTADKIGVQ